MPRVAREQSKVEIDLNFTCGVKPTWIDGLKSTEPAGSFVPYWDVAVKVCQTLSE